MEINKDGQIVIDVMSVFDNISGEKKLELVERLSCEDEIITFVMQQVFDGTTENGYGGSESLDDLRISSPLQAFREQVRQQSNRLLLKELNRLRGELSNRRKYYDRGWNEYHRLYNKVLACRSE